MPSLPKPSGLPPVPESLQRTANEFKKVAETKSKEISANVADQFSSKFEGVDSSLQAKKKEMLENYKKDDVMEILSGARDDVVGKVRSKALDISEPVVNDIKSVIEKVKGETIPEISGKAKGYAKEAVGTLEEKLKSTSKTTLEPLSKQAETLISSTSEMTAPIRKNVEDIVEKNTPTARKAYETVSNGARKGAEVAGPLIKRAGEVAIPVAKKAGEMAVPVVKQAANLVKDYAPKAYQWTIDRFPSVVTIFQNLVSSVLQFALRTIQSVAALTWTLFSNAFPKTSQNLASFGRATVRMISFVVNIIKSAAETVQKTILSIQDAIEKAGKAAEPLLSWVKIQLKPLQNVLNQVAADLSSVIASKQKSIEKALARFVYPVTSSIVEASKQIRQSVGFLNGPASIVEEKVQGLVILGRAEALSVAEGVLEEASSTLGSAKDNVDTALASVTEARSEVIKKTQVHAEAKKAIVEDGRKYLVVDGKW
eukprot:CAMPEP_0167754092 /NCGR_PEP_ID=MMETSP0110_2-20121227/8079_1 /TAXON_ID=629695 /ORGANISM="Gymnochlora sp., Strain CCMP2014" /LENGTH=482 /DNA_ID=CAMNT_0007639935 /DNA_START=339 /DNA_END=1785 /DNA_ORIENTATION=-